MAGSSGCVGLLVVVAAIYFSDAGSWMARQLNAINDNCYTTLSGVGAEIANPVCQGVAAGFNAANQVVAAASDKMGDIKQRILGNSSMEILDGFVSDLAENVIDLASPSSDLTRMMSLGPNNPQTFAANQPFQSAIDSFAIGQSFLNDSGMIFQGIPWLKHGAQQPMGYGVMSQLTLGNVYLKGGPGIPANPNIAAAYLQQASQSISVLSTSNTPQSQQLLKTLPMSPPQMQREIERVMRELKSAGR